MGKASHVSIELRNFNRQSAVRCRKAGVLHVKVRAHDRLAAY